MRASEHFTKLLLQGSLYADRFPIGLMEVGHTPRLLDVVEAGRAEGTRSQGI